ncbi:hypothetical protein GF362_01260 [Candidatus Dojkabacteria bacterium]|nr:hypothetical protein [Candidatus Dojkabacteria bacterium]
MTKNDNICCPKLDTKKWDNKTHNWEAKPFIKESMFTFFHMPFPPVIGKRITKLWKAATEADKAEKNKEDVLILFTDPSPFKSEIYMSVDGKVPDEDNVNISGKFVSKVFEGSYSMIPKFMKEMDKYLENEGKEAKKYYIHYAYCPKCMKKYGHNHMIFFAKI